jgi:hypothetical protein
MIRGIMLLACLMISSGSAFAQYHETKYPFNGRLVRDGTEFRIASLKVVGDGGSRYIQDLRLIESLHNGSSQRQLPMDSVMRMDFVAMSPEEEEKACVKDKVPCLSRKADVVLKGSTLKNIYVWVHGLAAITTDGDTVELNDRNYKTYSLIREQGASSERKK